MRVLGLLALAAALAAPAAAREWEEPGFEPCRPEFSGPSDSEDRNLVVLEFNEAFFGKIPIGCNFKDTEKCGVGAPHVFQWEINHGCEGHPDCQELYAELFRNANELQMKRKLLRCDKKARALLREWNSEKRHLGKWLKCEWKFCHGGMTCVTGAGYHFETHESLEVVRRNHIRGPWFCTNFVCDEDPKPQNGEHLENPCPNKIVDTRTFCRTEDGQPVAWEGGKKDGFHRDDTMWGSADVCRKAFPKIPRPGKGKLQQLIDANGK